MSTEHTPGTMRVEPLSPRDTWPVLKIGDVTVASVWAPKPNAVATVEQHANAARLALAWNSHDALVKAARRALTVLKSQGESVRPGNVLGALQDALDAAASPRT